MKQLSQPIPREEHFIPALSLKRRLDYFIDKYHFSSPQRGSDDLDDYEAILLEIDGEHFLLVRYARFPDDMVDVFIPKHMRESTKFLEQIVRELQVSKDDVTPHW